MIIEDSGSANKLIIDKEGRLRGMVDTRSQWAYKAKAEQSYEFHPPRMLLTSASGNSPLVYMQNTSTTKNFHIRGFRIGYSGGDTTFNKPCIVRLYMDMVVPTANVTIGQFGVVDATHNLYIGSKVTAPLDFRFWNGTGTAGFTTSDIGAQISCAYFTQGLTTWLYEGALILPRGRAIGLAAEAIAEDGHVIIVTDGWFEDEGVR